MSMAIFDFYTMFEKSLGGSGTPSPLWPAANDAIVVTDLQYLIEIVLSLCNKTVLFLTSL